MPLERRELPQTDRQLEEIVRSIQSIEVALTAILSVLKPLLWEMSSVVRILASDE